MTKDEAIAYFGTKAALAKALGIYKSAVSQWKKYPPDGRQFEIQILTRGKLKATPQNIKRGRAA